MARPKVTVIVPTYNRSKLLRERALASLEKQTFRNFETIIVDDASTDDTEQATKNYWAHYIKLPKNSGSAVAKKKALETAKGEYIVFLDDDNELLPTFLEKTIKVLDDNPTVHAVQVGRYIHHRSNGQVYTDYAAPGQSYFPQAIDWGWLIRRDVFDAITWDPLCAADEDMDFGIKFFQKFEAEAVYEPLSIAYGYGESETDSQSFPTERRLKGLEYFITKHYDLYKNYPNELRYLYRLAGRNFYLAGHKLKGLKYFWKSFFAQPSFYTFEHLLWIHFGWKAYNNFMTQEEKALALDRMHADV